MYSLIPDTNYHGECAPQISQEDTDAWKLHENGELKLMEDKNLYPPRMTLNVIELPSKPEVIQVTFKGTQEKEEQMRFSVEIVNKKGRQSTQRRLP